MSLTIHVLIKFDKKCIFRSSQSMHQRIRDTPKKTFTSRHWWMHCREMVSDCPLWRPHARQFDPTCPPLWQVNTSTCIIVAQRWKTPHHRIVHLLQLDFFYDNLHNTSHVCLHARNRSIIWRTQNAKDELIFTIHDDAHKALWCLWSFANTAKH